MVRHPHPLQSSTNHTTCPIRSCLYMMNTVYMVPESREKRVVSLHRAVEFPHRWQLVKNLMEEVDAVDATLLRHEGRWSLFANIVENPGASSFDELFLFSSDDLLTGSWTPHPCNPIVSDVRRARPAGRLFERDGELFPARHRTVPVATAREYDCIGSSNCPRRHIRKKRWK